MERFNLTLIKTPILLLLLVSTLTISAQVGIGTTAPNSDALLDIDASTTVGGLLLPRVALTGTGNAAPLSAHVQGMTVFNTATAGDVSPGQYYNNGTRWIRNEGEDTVDSASLAADVTFTSVYPTYTNVPGVSVTFTARKSNVLVLMTASGFGFTGSQSIVYLRVQNTTSGTNVGGTMTKVQNLDTFYVPGPPGPGGYIQNTTTTWSASFSKLLTGLTVGTTYILQAQSAVLGTVGTNTAVIQAATTPDAEHLTLSVMQ